VRESRLWICRAGLAGLALLAVPVLAGRAVHAAEVPASARPAPASTVVTAALKTAAAEHKVVLIEFGASWCTWCRRFQAFVHAPGLAPIVAANYVVVNLVVQEQGDKKALENPGGQDAMDRWGGGKAGLPFYVFLDASGRKIADSNAMPDGTNVGFPGNEREVAVFLGLLDRTAPRLSAADRGAMTRYLEASIAR
jgi:thiol:disulfide interchange protein